ncbi:restriction endonuclease subunit S [Sphaerotilus sp.]|uniref:restriction endonuclease subunit S n=1 Tax=Sphaerotilus sp. TaxID=2093942 RepID=UPI0034E199D4
MSFPRYEHYKDSGVEWLGKVPAHWEVKSIKHLSSRISSGKTPLGGSETYVDDGVIFIRSQNVYDDGLHLDDVVFISNDVDDLMAASRIMPGDILLNITGASIGRSCIVPADLEHANVNQHVCAIRPIEKSIAAHIEWSLKSVNIKRQIDFVQNGAAREGLNFDQIGSMKIAVPPNAEGALISKYLTSETTKLDALITEQRTLIDLLKEKRQAVISHAVTKGLDPRVPMKDSGVEWLGEVPVHWDVTKAGRYLSILPGYAFPSTEFSLDEANTKLLRGINVGVSKIKWDETVYWKRFDGDGLDAFELADGDIVIGMDRPYISEGMRVARISEADLPCLLLQRVAAIRASGKLSDDNILLLLSSNMFLDHFSPETTGVSVPHISPSQIAEFIIPIPPLEEQKDIFKWVEVETTRIDALTAEAQTTIALLQERRSALISAAVTGKIDVRQAAPA